MEFLIIAGLMVGGFVTVVILAAKNSGRVHGNPRRDNGALTGIAAGTIMAHDSTLHPQHHHDHSPDCGHGDAGGGSDGGGGGCDGGGGGGD